MRFCRMALKRMLHMALNNSIFVNMILLIRQKDIIAVSVEKAERSDAACLIKQEKICQKLNPAENFLNGFARKSLNQRREKRTRIMERLHLKKQKRN